MDDGDSELSRKEVLETSSGCNCGGNASDRRSVLKGVAGAALGVTGLSSVANADDEPADFQMKEVSRETIENQVGEYIFHTLAEADVIAEPTVDSLVPETLGLDTAYIKPDDDYRTSDYVLTIHSSGPRGDFTLGVDVDAPTGWFIYNIGEERLPTEELEVAFERAKEQFDPAEAAKSDAGATGSLLGKMVATIGLPLSLDRTMDCHCSETDACDCCEPKNDSCCCYMDDCSSCANCRDCNVVRGECPQRDDTECCPQPNNSCLDQWYDCCCVGGGTCSYPCARACSCG